jgi:hypothetical protein
MAWALLRLLAYFLPVFCPDKETQGWRSSSSPFDTEAQASEEGRESLALFKLKGDHA